MTLRELLYRELTAVFSNSAILLTIFGGVVFYSFLYPLPYLEQTPQEQEITLVNLDNSQLSRRLERMVDATPQVTIAARAGSIKEAKEQFMQGQARGILVIPEHFYRDLLLAKSPTLSYSGDASYFLVYGTIANTLATVGGTLAAQTKVTRLLADGTPLESATQQYAEIKTNMKPTFNPTIGYVNYVVPAIFVLILQQTLIMGSGLLGGSEKTRSGYWHEQPAVRVVAMRTLVFVVIYYLLALYYFGFSFNHYDINQLASPMLILALLAPLLLTSSFIGICLGALLPRRELITVVVLMSSLPLVFSAGFVWPLESVPQPMIWLSELFPFVPAMQGLIAINQMGADFSQIAAQWSLLWIQVAVWFWIAFFAYKRSQQNWLN